MLFNSFDFLFAFLPVAYLGSLYLFKSGRENPALLFVVVCSLFFYGFWNPAHIWVIMVSLGANYVLSGHLTAATRPERRRALLFLGVAFNLGMLGYFKYAGFFTNIFQASDTEGFFASVLNTALPIGISFFTFQQIAFLVDCYRHHRERPYDLVRYAFFVTFFPQLIAGPIVHHAEIMPQLENLGQRLRGSRYVSRYFAPGLALLLIGLTKKVMIADTFGIFANQSFMSAHITNLTFFGAWGGASAYTLQIYFDFSGYSDMAIGLGLLFGLRLPVNFLSPYKARSIIEFWRRWHMTLSRFLRDYLYFPLGGNRNGVARRHLNLLLTMTLGGLWHGANWTFVLWGVIHGALLAANHGLRRFVPWTPPAWLAVSVTFTLVMLAWVPFRAETLPDALRVYQIMFGAEGIVLPWHFESLVETLGPVADMLSIRTGNIRYFGGRRQALATALALGVVFFAPCSMTLLDRKVRHRAMGSWLFPVGLGVCVTGVLFLIMIEANTTFLYFQF